MYCGYCLDIAFLFECSKEWENGGDPAFSGPGYRCNLFAGIDLEPQWVKMRKGFSLYPYRCSCFGSCSIACQLDYRIKRTQVCHIQGIQGGLGKEEYFRAHILNTLNSIRRFIKRCASESLGTMGLRSPLPTTEIKSSDTPNSTINCLMRSTSVNSGTGIGAGFGALA